MPAPSRRFHPGLRRVRVPALIWLKLTICGGRGTSNHGNNPRRGWADIRGGSVAPNRARTGACGGSFLASRLHRVGAAQLTVDRTDRPRLDGIVTTHTGAAPSAALGTAPGARTKQHAWRPAHAGLAKVDRRSGDRAVHPHPGPGIPPRQPSDSGHSIVASDSVLLHDPMASKRARRCCLDSEPLA